MKTLAICLFALSLALVGKSGAQTLEATTNDGAQVMLFPDGTWKYKETETGPPAAFNIPASSTEVYRSKKGIYEIWVDPSKWTQVREPVQAPREFEWVHISGDAYALAIVERISMPLDALKRAALENARQASPDLAVVHEQELVVNGQQMAAMQLQGAVNGIPFTYFGYYWTGKAGAIQLLTFTGSNLFEELQRDFQDFLSGLVITKP